MKVCLLNDTSTVVNWGDRATIAALRRMIESCSAEIVETRFYPDIVRLQRYVSRSLAKPVDQFVQAAAARLPVERSRLARFTRPIWSRTWDPIVGAEDAMPGTYSEFEKRAEKVLSGDILEDIRRAIEKCDVVVVNGGGAIYDRQRKGIVVLFLAYLAKVHFAKPCILVNHTADIHDPVMSEIASQVYPLLDDALFREHLSAEACAPYRPQGADSVAADAAYLWEPIGHDAWASVVGRADYFSVWPDRADGFDPNEPYVCVGASSIYLRADRPDYDPVPGFIELCKRLADKVAPVVLTATDNKDARILGRVADKLQLPLIGSRLPFQQAVDILGNSLAYVGGRWHPSIFAVRGGAPITTLTANSFKTRALVEQMGLEGPTFDALTIHDNVSEIVDYCGSLIAQGEALRERLRDRASEMSRLAWENVRFLKRMTSKGTP